MRIGRKDIRWVWLLLWIYAISQSDLEYERDEGVLFLMS